MKKPKRPAKAPVVVKEDPRPLLPGDARCTVCGCTDTYGCMTGCWWITVDRRKRKGVCSNCAKKKVKAS